MGILWDGLSTSMLAHMRVAIAAGRLNPILRSTLKSYRIIVMVIKRVFNRILKVFDEL